MDRKQKFLLFIFAVLLCGLIAGCNINSAMNSTVAAENFLTVEDDAKRTVHLAKKPEKIVVLSPSFLAPLGALDAALIGRPTSKTGVPDFAQPLAEVGAVYNINIEKVVGLQPDLVIAYQGMHEKFVSILDDNQIPVIVLRMKTYQDVQDKLKLFGQITEQQQKSQAIAALMEEKTQQIVKKMPKQAKKIVILHSTAKSVTVDLEGSIAGSAAKLLGFHNVAVGSPALEREPDATPYSLETLVEQNPEIIFVVTMGKLEEIQKKMMVDIESNQAWSSLEAVKNKRVYFLPQELFLLNPGLDYPLAFETMARLAYPEVFDHAK